MTDTPKILVVDDQEINRIVLGEILRRQGYLVLEASNGPDARKLASAEEPDVILLDVMMPGEQGFETCRKLKANPDTADITVIFVSAVFNIDSKMEGFNSGAVDYITKPFHAVEVAARVRLHLRLARAQSQLAIMQAQRLQEIAQAQAEILVDPSELPDAKFAVARRSIAEAGGDFYEVLPLGRGRYCYLVADVSGHGLKASFTTAALKALTAQNATAVNTPAETLKTMNSVLRRIMADGSHITACYVNVNRQTYITEVICAGHPQVLWFPQDGDPSQAGAPGEPLGVFPSLVLTPDLLKTKPGDRIYVYTDGVVEGEGRTRSEGIAELTAILSGRQGEPLAAGVAFAFEKMAMGSDDALLMGIEL